MNSDDPLATAIAEWQRKHRIADDDPIIAVLDLVRLQLQHASHERDGAQPAPPSFEEFRGTVELLDRRSKTFVSQAADLVSELRRFGQNVQRLNRFRFAVVVLMTALGMAAGVFAGGLLMNTTAGYAVVAILWTAALLLLITHGYPTRRNRTVVRLGGFKWTRADFCRGWLITGDTGSGKTRSGITPLLFQVFRNEPTWGGLCIDDKGIYWETLSQMARHFGREDDLILLQVRPEDGALHWQPKHTYNLTADRSIPYSTFAKAVVDTAWSLGQAGDKGFFKNQAQIHIAAALETLREIGADVTLENAYHLLLDQGDLDEAMTDLASGQQTARRRELSEHFTNRFLSQPPEQIGGVKETIANYLQAFITPDIAEVFCAAASTFDFADIDRGKIICVAMPQKFQVERRYVNTFLKMLFYTHALRRFDKPADERRHDNLLVLWADEAQRFVTSSDSGMSDYNCIDVIREAQATLVAAAQSSSSFIPPLGREKARVFTLNLRNRLIFKAADEEGAVESAEFLGKRRKVKRSWGYSAGKQSSNYSEHDEPKIKPHVLRNFPKHTAVIVHCERGHRKKLLPPVGADGKVCNWFR